MEYITIEDVKGLNIDGYTSEEDFGGGLLWTNPKTKISIWATPNWDEEEGKIPFAYDIDGDEHIHVMTVDLMAGSSDINEQIELYVTLVKTIIQLAKNSLVVRN